MRYFRTLLLYSLLVAALVCSSCIRGANNSDTTALTEPADTATANGPAQAVLYFVGDAMQHKAQLDRAKDLGKGNEYDYSGCFDLIAPTVQRADYAVVNLEVPLGGGRGGYTGFPCFSAPDAFAVALKDAGFDLFLTANNHTLDRRDLGLRRTIQVLDSLRVDHIGTYTDKKDRNNKIPFIRNINGIKIAFLNYTYGTNGINATDGAEVSLIDRETMASEINVSRQAGAEIVVVCVHWGVEYQLKEHPSQRTLAQFLVDQGVDMIIGSHPHVIQPMKLIDNPKTGKKTLIVYSLGNFISNMKTNDTRGGASVTCYLERDNNSEAHVTRAEYDTFFSSKPAGGRSNFRVIPSTMTDSIPPGQSGWWNAFNNAAERVFTTQNQGVPRVK